MFYLLSFVDYKKIILYNINYGKFINFFIFNLLYNSSFCKYKIYVFIYIYNLSIKLLMLNLINILSRFWLDKKYKNGTIIQCLIKLISIF